MDSITKIDLGQGTSAAPETVSLEDTHSMKSLKRSKFLVPLIIVGVIAGSFTGYLVAKQRLLLAKGITSDMSQNPEDAGALKAGAVFGSADEKTFRDKAEGIIQPGGIAGEGSHHLTRGEDKSQWVYLTSSVVDLDTFVGTKVTVWGETVGAKKAGWLMDVGRLKVEQLNAAEVNAIEPAE